MPTTAVTYSTSLPELTKARFVCKRCKREYAPLLAGERPIRCECGWWYYNDGVALREVFWQRISPYRVPPELAHLFPTD